MEEYLCVVRQDDSVDWFLLCVRDSFYVISCGNRESIIRAIRALKKRYRTVFGLKQALSNMSTPAKCNQYARQIYEAVYEEQRGKYDFLLNDTLEEEYEKIREKRKPKKPILVKRKPVPTKAPSIRPTAQASKRPSVSRKVMKPMKARLR